MAKRLLTQIEDLSVSRRTLRSLRIPVELADAIDLFADYHGGEEVSVAKEETKNDKNKKRTDKENDKDKKKESTILMKQKLRRWRRYHKYGTKKRINKDKEISTDTGKKKMDYRKTYVQKHCNSAQLIFYLNLVITLEKRKLEGISDDQPGYDPDQIDDIGGGRLTMKRMVKQPNQLTFHPFRTLMRCPFRKERRELRWILSVLVLKRKQMKTDLNDGTEKLKAKSLGKRKTKRRLQREVKINGQTFMRNIDPIDECDIPEFLGDYKEMSRKSNGREGTSAQVEDRSMKWSDSECLQGLYISDPRQKPASPDVLISRPECSVLCVEPKIQPEQCTHSTCSPSRRSKLQEDAQSWDGGLGPTKTLLQKKYQVFNSRIRMEQKQAKEMLLEFLSSLGLSGLSSDDLCVNDAASTMISGTETYNFVFTPTSETCANRLEAWVTDEKHGDISNKFNLEKYDTDKHNYSYVMPYESLEMNATLTLLHLVFLGMEQRDSTVCTFSHKGIAQKASDGNVKLVTFTDLFRDDYKADATCALTKMSQAGTKRVKYMIKNMNLPDL